MTVSDARANRAGLFAKRVYTPSTAYAYPTLGAVHEVVEQMSEEQLAQEIQKCRLAKTNASPIIKGMTLPPSLGWSPSVGQSLW